MDRDILGFTDLKEIVFQERVMREHIEIPFLLTKSKDEALGACNPVVKGVEHSTSHESLY